jgi:SSS family solute:Na+ symporter
MLATVGTIDWVILGLSVLGVAAGGTWFARRQRSTEQYFVGGRSVPGWAAGLSMFANVISTITFLAYPGQGYGGDFRLLLPGLMLPVVILFVAGAVIPFYRRFVRMSAYEYLEQRFGYPSRAYAAIVFLALNLFRLSFILFLSAKAIHTVTGWDIRTIILVSGAITIVYTVAGGIEAVIWTDVLQSFIMLGGGVMCVIVLLLAPESGPLEAVRTAYAAGKFRLAECSLDLTRPTIVVTVLYGLFSFGNGYITTQDSVQRYLATPTTRQACRGVWLGAFSSIAIWTMFMFIGSMLFVYYRLHPEQLPAAIAADQEKVFPHFILTRFPAGTIGLVLAAMVAAAMSTLSAVMNCLSMVTVCDFLGRASVFRSDRRRLMLGRVATCAWGIIGTAAALLMINVARALDFYYVVTSILCGGLLGIFMLAFLVRRARAAGVYAGLVAGVIIPAWGAMDRLIGLGLPLPAFLQHARFPFHPYLVIVCSNAAAFLVGYGVCRLLPPPVSGSGATLWDLRSAQPERDNLPGADGDPNGPA